MLINDQYVVTLDIFPQEVEEHTMIYPFFQSLREGRLTTTRCKKCGKIAWSPQVVCPYCLNDELEWVDLPTKGKVKVFTQSAIMAPLGFENPITHALVELEGEKLTIFTRLVNVEASEPLEGIEVELAVLPIHNDRVVYAFKPVGSL